MKNPSRKQVRKANDNSTRVRATASLVAGNIKLHGRRTSVRLEPEMWRALHDVAEAERLSIHDICSTVDDCKGKDESFSSALRVFLLKYYRAAASDIRSGLQTRLRPAEANMPKKETTGRVS